MLRNDSQAHRPCAPEAGQQMITGELLRGTLLEPHNPTHRPKCARGEGDQVFVLTVTYPDRCVRQISVRRERVPRCASDVRTQS
jgi:hypothetical protein